jgi:hypothetical protein
LSEPVTFGLSDVSSPKSLLEVLEAKNCLTNVLSNGEKIQTTPRITDTITFVVSLLTENFSNHPAIIPNEILKDTQNSIEMPPIQQIAPP